MRFAALWLCALTVSGADRFTPQQRRYWAFQPVNRAAPPAVSHRDWVRTPIDNFILQKLEAKAIAPGREASRIQLIRRATFDLTGLPPTPQEVRAFLEDPSPAAFEKVVDRLLASPQYGERWARHWLDVARYAESTGFEDDVTRPNAWRYRDYVIHALNSDKPYNRFVREQIAGDELWPQDPDARVATAFNRHYPEEGNQKDLLLARQETLHDITSVTGAAFLGLTFECARCHDHKFDPILQRDYYRLQAFFSNVDHDDRIPLVTGDELRQYQQRLAEWEAKTAAIWDEMAALLMPKRNFTPAQLLERYPDYAVQAIKTPDAARTPIQRWMAHLLASKTCGTCPVRPKPYLDPLFKSVASKLTGADKARYEQLQAELEKLAPLKPEEIPMGPGMIDVGPDAPPTHVLGVGLYTDPREEVEPGFLSILDPGPAQVAKPASSQSTGRRTALANWLADPANPLTARVMVNRVWHHHFGTGIVSTPGDFGTMGARPTHPELLDWLTSEFIRSGWSLKQLHRLIMTSSTYRQSSLPRTDARNADRDNKLLWRFPPQRLEAETIRDSALAVSGLLNPGVGGPSVFPPLPAGKPQPVGGWNESKSAADRQRRSIYIFMRRNDPYPMLNAMDLPDSHESCSRRNRTTTAPQALTLLNSALTAEWAAAFANRVRQQAGPDAPKQVEAAYRFAYSRPPAPGELDTALTFLSRHGAQHSASAALVDFCLMLINSNEFVYQF
ncbi:MAG: DUF1549 and DUF1553 domain-containing protein [Bryobacteraceae bacterium]|nr:DUF1549 and DUF1553 domain-containing protein [Bryobacteraceae bacterium]